VHFASASKIIATVLSHNAAKCSGQLWNCSLEIWWFS